MAEPISTDSIAKLLKELPKSTLDDASQTYLPTILPLALPSPEHTLNFFTTLHLIHHTLAQPIHAAYFHETNTTPRDAALRGSVSLFLASEEKWTSANLLSAAAWKKDKLDERAVSEHFEIQVIREKEHETMKAIRVGERWDKAVDVAAALVELFRGLGERLESKSVGEAVKGLVEESQEVANGDVAIFARVFTEQVSQNHSIKVSQLMIRRPSLYQARATSRRRMVRRSRCQADDSPSISTSTSPARPRIPSIRIVRPGHRSSSTRRAFRCLAPPPLNPSPPPNTHHHLRLVPGIRPKSNRVSTITRVGPRSTVSRTQIYFKTSHLSLVEMSRYPPRTLSIG
jgi:hypothetical protein